MKPQATKGGERGRVLDAVRRVPLGRVATISAVASAAGVPLRLAMTILANATDDERELAPLHRVVADGGAIGRGPYRDQQFARLVREGVPVSPAGIVQDMERTALGGLNGLPILPSSGAPVAAPAALPLSRSRGMKDRP